MDGESWSGVGDSKAFQECLGYSYGPLVNMEAFDTDRFDSPFAGFASISAHAATASALALGSASAWAFPVVPVTTDSAVIQVAKKSHNGEMSRDTTAVEHKTKCWVKRDSVREFGYWKC